MATINYQFSDGHYEEIEVTEDFKREYELLERQDLRRYWKIKQQKYRAGIGCKYDLSLDTHFLRASTIIGLAFLYEFKECL